MNKRIFGMKISTIVSVLVCLIAAILFWTIANWQGGTIAMLSDVPVLAIEGVKYV